MMREPPPRQRPNEPNGNPAAARQQERPERAFERPGHLQQWMQNHSNMPLADQQRALQNEPGFRELDPQTQQRLLNRLANLHAISPQQRERRLSQAELLEQMSPAQRQQWYAAKNQLFMLPGPRRSMVAHALLDLRDLPPAQREQVIDSPAFAQEFPDPNDRAMIRTLLTTEPYPPIPVR